ncbi:MAG: RNA polymerase sigma factor [Lysobacter sp.]
MNPISERRCAQHEPLPTSSETEATAAAWPADAACAGATDFADFADFVREHESALVSFLSARIHPEDAKDIAQESLLRLMRYRNHPPGQLKPLMYRIALNTLNDHARRLRSRYASLHDSLDYDASMVPSAELAHDQRLANEHDLTRVRAAILQLPTRCRQVYLLNRIEDMSYAEIARHCDISVKAVEKHISKALTMLRGCLRAPNPDGAEGR